MDGAPAPPRSRVPRAVLLAGLPVAAFAVAFLLTLALQDGDAEPPAPPPPAAAGTDPTALSGEGRLVLTLFAGGEELVAGYLASVAPDGSDVRPITGPPDADTIASDVAPSLSPDGETIAFQRATSGPTRGTEPHIHLVGLDGSGLRRLTRGRGAELDPAWSPDGSTIAFARHAGGSFDLAACSPDGCRVAQLTATRPADEDFPAWSPDGSLIAFARYEDGFEASGGDLWVMRTDGTGERLLLGGPDDDTEPAWSPDGAQIAFTRNGRVAVMDADGSGLRELTDAGGEREFRPRWDPDGSRILFTRDPGLVLSVAVDGSGLEQLELDGLADGAVWEPSS